MAQSKPKVEIVLPSPARTLVAKKHLTIPLISMAHLPILTALILGEIYTEDKIKAAGKDVQVAPKVILVRNLETNEDALLVVNAIMASAFERAGSPLTGRIFQFRAGTIRDGKTYRDIDVTEMEYESPLDAA